MAPTARVTHGGAVRSTDPARSPTRPEDGTGAAPTQQYPSGSSVEPQPRLKLRSPSAAISLLPKSNAVARSSAAMRIASARSRLLGRRRHEALSEAPNL